VFESLATEVDELSIPLCGEAIIEVLAIQDRLQAKVSDVVADFDRAGLWDLDSATSLTAWLRRHGAMTKREAGRVSGRVKKLRELPVTAAAWQAGELSGGQVEAMVAILKPEMLALFAEHEAELVPSLVGLSVTDTSRAMSHWAAHAAALTDEPEAPESKRGLHLSQLLDGTWVLNGTLDPESGEVISTALRQAESPDSEAEPARTPRQRRIDALDDICRFYLDHQHHRPAGRHRPHVNVVIDFEDLQSGGPGQVVDGPTLSGAVLRAMTCDSALHRLVMSGHSAVLDYGTSTRTIPTALWNALVLRDEHCHFPGCDRRSSWCEGHVRRAHRRRRAHLPGKPRSPVFPPSPPPAPARVARQASARCHLGGHRSRWRHWFTAAPRAGPTLV
jgi:hypothetical protein